MKFMLNRFSFIYFAAYSFILFFPNYALAGAESFSCSSQNGIPTTIAIMSSGKRIPMIRWVSDVFSGDGWSPSRRCQEVSERFTEFNRQGILRYLTTGRMNGLNVICVALSKDDRCSGLLYTLKPGQNPSETLRQLFGVRRYATGPLNETGDREYIDINEYLGLGSSDQLPQKSTGDKLNAW